jgi:gas vesicle protein
VALLLAPRNGKETRDWLTRKARELKDRTEGALEEAGEAVRRESRSLADRTSKDLAGVREMVR